MTPEITTTATTELQSLGISPVALISMAAQMTAEADSRLHTGPPDISLHHPVIRNRWTMLLYDAMRVRPIDIPFIERLEQSINQELRGYKLPTVSFARIWRKHELRKILLISRK